MILKTPNLTDYNNAIFLDTLYTVDQIRFILHFIRIHNALPFYNLVYYDIFVYLLCIKQNQDNNYKRI